MLVEVNSLPEGWILLRSLEEGRLLHHDFTVAALHRLYDRVRVDALVNMERDGGYLEGGVLGLTSPHKLRVEVRVVGVGLALAIPVCFRRHQARRRIVFASLVEVLVLLYRLLAFGHPPHP
jgi:hypothetical protein